jgi:hypothetical protein
VSNPDSFIDEVTEEVRRDRLFAAFRKYGWIGIVLVLGIVGGASWNEWQKATDQARAQAFGDGVLDAFDLGGDAERRTALEAINATESQLAIKALLLSSDPSVDKTAALAALDQLIADPAEPEIYRDLAVLRRLLVAGSDMPLADRRASLEAIAAPGRSFGLLAQEQLAYLLVEEGKSVDAIALLSTLMQDQGAPSGLRQRAAQMIIALGGQLPELAPVSDAG